MKKYNKIQVNILRIFFIVFGLITLMPQLSKAKGGDQQDQIILLNDSAAALEDSNPDLSKRLTQWADAEEKDWEAKNANKEELPAVITDKNKVLDEVNILKKASLAIQSTYPLIAEGLDKMAKNLERTIENEK